MTMHRLTQMNEQLQAWREALATRAPVLSDTLSLAALIGLACLPALAAPQPAAPGARRFNQLSAPAQSRRVTAIGIETDALAASTGAEPRKIAGIAPSKTGQVAELTKAKSPVPAPAPNPGEPSAAPAAHEEQAQPWSQAAVVAGLRDCVRDLAAITAEIEVLAPIKHGQCGAPAPISLRRLGVWKVELQPAATTTCQMARALHQWLELTVQPIAREIFASPVKRLNSASSYVCRNRNNERSGPISEHAFANAIDIVGFMLEDGRTITVLEGWGATARERQAGETSQAVPKIDPASSPVTAPPPRRLGGPAAASAAAMAEPAAATNEAKFLRLMHKGACGVFGTVLGPEANSFHRNHFHLDLKLRKSRAFCE